MLTSKKLEDIVEIVCSTSKNKKLYTWGIDTAGRKNRLPNEYAIKGIKEQGIKRCDLDKCKIKKYCKGGPPPKLPCKYKKHLFNSMADVDDYCKIRALRPKEYEKSKIKKLAKQHTADLKREAKELKSKKSKPNKKNTKVEFYTYTISKTGVFLDLRSRVSRSKSLVCCFANFFLSFCLYGFSGCLALILQ